MDSINKLAYIISEKEFDYRNNSDRKRFLEASKHFLFELSGKLRHEKREVFFNFDKQETGVAVLETNRVHIEISKNFNTPYEISYRTIKGEPRFASIKAVSENPDLFIDNIRMMVFREVMA
jgi:hypothetical protein